MHSDGKQLEALIAFVEETLVPPGFEVKANSRVFNDEGVQIAEFDIEIRGKVGSTSIAWLIECRDRPGQGAAPGSWIEQLVGRRDRFGFNKVTAVSTTGFATGAADYARRAGIELREVQSIDPDSFKGWLQISGITQISRIHDLKHARIILGSDEPEAVRLAALRAIERSTGNDAVLVIALTKEHVTVTEAFMGAVQAESSAFDGVTVEHPKNVRITVQYPEGNHFYIETEEGDAKVDRIEFFGELRVEEALIPVVRSEEYRQVETGEVISQLAAFAPHSVMGVKLAFELHRMGEDGETHILMRRLPGD
ncbi:MAG: hypothetical protein REI94_16185 [Moraxellaceae bacterium]|nr:hypothetical protein [Moraxellaceae bacterium]